MNEVRFAFGDNWSEYSQLVGDEELEQAISGLRRLLPGEYQPSGMSFLDIGSGSGLHAVAASRLGFSDIVATDYDGMSVETTRATAAKFGAEIDSFRDDILDTKLSRTFDVVYSWGVLHHTGDMAKAIGAAARLVAPGGLLIIAIYVKTGFCGMWRSIKRTYCISPRPIQTAMIYGYHAARSLRQIPTGELFQNYRTKRGMDHLHDSIDWLGGYPYESATPDEVIAMVPGFTLLKSFSTTAGVGLLGAGCGEYVFRKV